MIEAFIVCLITAMPDEGPRDYCRSNTFHAVESECMEVLVYQARVRKKDRTMSQYVAGYCRKVYLDEVPDRGNWIDWEEKQK